jgi:hypothetical protein
MVIDVWIYHISECDRSCDAGSSRAVTVQRMEGWQEMTLPLDDNPSLLKRIFMAISIVAFLTVFCTCCSGKRMVVGGRTMEVFGYLVGGVAALVAVAFILTVVIVIIMNRSKTP